MSASRARFHAAQARAYRKLDNPPEMELDAWLDSNDQIRQKLVVQLDQTDNPLDIEYLEFSLQELGKRRERIIFLFENQREYELLDIFADVLNRDLEFVAEAAERMGHSTDQTLVIGTFPTGSINAKVLPVDDTADSRERYIVVDSGLPTFANLLAKAVTNAVPCFRRPDNSEPDYLNDIALVEREIMKDPQAVVTRYAELIQSYVANGDPNAAPRYLVSPDSVVISGRWLSSIEQFIVAHEYAHVVRGVMPKIVEDDSVRQAFARAIEAELSRFDELESDQLAMNIVIEAYRQRFTDFEYVNKFVIFPIFVMFYALSDLQWAVDSILSGTHRENGPPKDSHPPPIDRLEALFKWLVEDYVKTDSAKASIQHSYDLAHKIMGYYGGMAQSMVAVAIERGIPVHPRWQ
ncbi:MAG: hypothetical protein GKR90_08605 [Pseudomonadales bacterium]|nr:hypothetical protein [Pseudomonadales bacterium]